MENNEVIVCADCGCVIEENEEYFELSDGSVICESCFNEDYFVCEDCGSIEPLDNAVTIHGRYGSVEHYVCQCCADRNYSYCENCEKYYQTYLVSSQWVNGNLFEICDSCLEDLNYCELCCEYFSDDNYDFDEQCCNSCAKENIIRDYHENDGWTTFGADSRRFGIELEVENKGTSGNNDIARYLKNNFLGNHAIYERDGSLDTGFEIISQPHTPDEFYKLDWEKVLEYLSNHGFVSHDSGTCGLHIHVSRKFFGDTRDEQYENIAKIVYCYSVNWQFFLKCSRRTQEQADRWAAEYVNGSFDEAKENVKNGYSRYLAINLCNYDTIEFRLGRGTLRYESFMAWIDLHLTMAKNARDVAESDLSNLSVWLDGIKDSTYEYINYRGAGEYINEIRTVA